MSQMKFPLGGVCAFTELPPVGEAPMGVGRDTIEWLEDSGLLRCSLRQSLHMNSLHSRQRMEALTSHQPQLMLELFEDSGDILGLLRAPLPMGPMLKSPCESRPPRKLLMKKSVRGGELGGVKEGI